MSDPGGCGPQQPECTGCRQQTCPLGEPPAGGALTGWRFAAAALGVFATPLGVALAGAVWFRESRDYQLAAALAGLCLGTALVVAAGRLLNRNREVLE